MLALAGGSVAALATPPIDLYPMMFVGLMLLALAIRDVPSFWQGAGIGLLWGAAGQLIVMRFVPSVIQLFTNLGTALSLLAHVLLSFAQSLHWALGMGLAVLLQRRAKAPLEVALGAGVLATLMLPSVFVWSPAGLLSPWPALLQSAEYVGERGVSVVFAMIAALMARAWLDYRAAREISRRAWSSAAAAVGALGLMAAHGAWAMSTHEPAADAPVARVALIHAGVSPHERWQQANWPRILAQLKRQTADAEVTGIDLSIWPEAAYPYPLPHDSLQAPRRKRQIVGGAIRGPILFGFIARDAAVKRPDGAVEINSYNAATIVMTDGKMVPSYDKMELLWFGETVPLAQHLPWLRRLFQRSGGLIPGRELRNLELPRDDRPPLNMGMFNCYEDTLPSFGRRVFNEHQPNLLVNVTNDAWFVGTREPELHLRLSVLRSIELRRDMVRAVNLGIASWIDGSGRVRAHRGDPTPGFLLAQPTLRDGPATVYARFGDVPAIILLAMASGYSWYRRRRDDGDISPEGPADYIDSQPAGSNPSIQVRTNSTPSS